MEKPCRQCHKRYNRLQFAACPDCGKRADRPIVDQPQMSPTAQSLPDGLLIVDGTRFDLRPLS